MNAEASVISAVCTNKDMPSVLSAGIDNMFVTHGDVWEQTKNYYYKYKGVPSIELLREKFPGLEIEPASAKTGFYIDELKSKYVTNKLVEAIKKAGATIKDDGGIRALDILQSDINSLSKVAATSRDLDVSDFDSARHHIEEVKKVVAERGGTFGIPTGFKAIDASYLTGMAPGHLIVVIGWPSRGKTWMTGYIAINAWKRGYRPMIVSLEMNPETMRDRLYTMMGAGRFDMADFTRGQLDFDEYDAWAKDYFETKGEFIIVSNEGQSEVTPNFIQAKVDQHRPDLVIVDYHQLLSDNSRTKSTIEANRNASKELKLLAVRNSIPVIDIVSATMSDVSDQNGPPMLSQVAWSKAIEYDADHAFAVHQDKESGLVSIVCRKNRHGTEYDFEVDVDLGRGIIREIY
jgi:replicative DNA helicase